jgi:hypothetical protein
MPAHPYRTVVDLVAQRRALVDADTVFAEIGVTAPTAAETTQMETVIAQASGLVDRFLDRVLAEEDVTDHFRQPRGEVLRLSRYPVVEILGVTEAGTALTDDDWELDEVTGQLWRISAGDRIWWSDAGAIQVSYIGGYGLPDDLPADIQRASIDQVKAQYLGGGRDPNLRSVQVPDVFQASYSVGGGDSFGKSGLLVQVERALAPHRRIAV